MTVHIEPVPDNPKKMALFWKGVLWRTVSKALFAQELGRLPQEMTQDEFFHLFSQMEQKLSRRYALSLLSRRAALSSELEKKLGEQGISPPVIQETLHWCVQQGYLDDTALLKRWIERERKKGRSRLAIYAKLTRQKGVDSEALQLLLASSDETALDSWLAKHAKQLQTADRRQRVKLWQKLARLGFSSALIRSKLTVNEDDN